MQQVASFKHLERSQVRYQNPYLADDVLGLSLYNLLGKNPICGCQILLCMHLMKMMLRNLLSVFISMLLSAQNIYATPTESAERILLRAKTIQDIWVYYQSLIPKSFFQKYARQLNASNSTIFGASKMSNSTWHVRVGEEFFDLDINKTGLVLDKTLTLSTLDLATDEAIKKVEDYLQKRRIQRHSLSTIFFSEALANGVTIIVAVVLLIVSVLVSGAQEFTAVIPSLSSAFANATVLKVECDKQPAEITIETHEADPVLGPPALIRVETQKMADKSTRIRIFRCPNPTDKLNLECNSPLYEYFGHLTWVATGEAPYLDYQIDAARKCSTPDNCYPLTLNRADPDQKFKLDAIETKLLTSHSSRVGSLAYCCDSKYRAQAENLAHKSQSIQVNTDEHLKPKSQQ